MNSTRCCNCGGEYFWQWEEAFYKFGFNDGDGQLETYTVGEVLTCSGYTVEYEQWGLHNTVISSIKLDELELLPLDSAKFQFGYDCPRDYLTEGIISILDAAFS